MMEGMVALLKLADALGGGLAGGVGAAKRVSRGGEVDVT
jgi:hypothetical protein